MIIKTDPRIFWGLIHGEAVNGAIDMLDKYHDAIGMVRYECQDLDSMRPDMFVMAGPSNTLKTIEQATVEKPHWSMRATQWASAHELREHAPPRYVKQRPPAPAPKGPMPEPSPEDVRLAKKLCGHYEKCSNVYGVRPLMVKFGDTVGYGMFFWQERKHENDRFVEYGVAQPDDLDIRYEIVLLGTRPKKHKVMLHWDHGMPRSAGYNGDLAEWYVGGHYEGKPSQHYPLGSAYSLTEWVPMNFGPYKDELIDEYDEKRRPRAAMRVIWL